MSPGGDSPRAWAWAWPQRPREQPPGDRWRRQNGGTGGTSVRSLTVTACSPVSHSVAVRPLGYGVVSLSLCGPHGVTRCHRHCTVPHAPGPARPRGTARRHRASLLRGVSHGVTITARCSGCHCHGMATGCHTVSLQLPWVVTRSHRQCRAQGMSHRAMSPHGPRVSRSVTVTAIPQRIAQRRCHCMAHGCHPVLLSLHGPRGVTVSPHSAGYPPQPHPCASRGLSPVSLHAPGVRCAPSRPCQPWGQPGDSVPVTGCPRAQREEGPQQIPVTAWHRSLCHRMTSHLGDTVSTCPGDNTEVAKSSEAPGSNQP